MQRALFETCTQVLVDDERGRIVYQAEAVPRADADRWFAALRDGTAWSSERRLMYEREVDVPRLMAHYALDDARLPAELAEAARLVGSVARCAFNTVGLNLYRDGNDSVAPHSDKLHDLAPGAPIGLVSLGAARRMTIREKAKPRRSLQLDLEPGSLLLMSYATQRHFDHGIPKTRAAVGPRISLAFRCRPSNG